MPGIWFVGGDAPTREDFGPICSSMDYVCTFFAGMIAAQKKLLSGECPAALFVFLERNIQNELKILDSIRKRAVWKDLAILVVLAEPGPEITAQIRDIGVDGTIRMPLSAEQVDQELRKALRRRKIFSSHSQK